MITNRKLIEDEISNHCVLICDLSLYVNRESLCWNILKGSQEFIGIGIADKLKDFHISRIDDFGGVCKSFLCKGEEYLESPPKTKPNAAIFSFTPRKRVISEGHDMARVAALSGYSLMILTLQKHDKFGKVWVLSAAINKSDMQSITYYEDTNTVVDEMKDASIMTNLTVVHVLSPGFEEFKSSRADRVISQEKYQNEVLA